jgi:peroxiredoxin
MRIYKIFLSLFLILNTSVYSQKNFSYLPEHPKPGDIITFTYEPAGAIMGTLNPVEASYYMVSYTTTGFKNMAADDIKLNRSGSKYTGTITTDTAANFVYFGFSSKDQFDNNFNNGYYIMLYDKDQPKQGSYSAQAVFYQYYGEQVGVESNNEKALEAFKKEMELYPSNRKFYLPQYFRLMNTLKVPDVTTQVQSEIESILKAGLKSEDDYETLESLYTVARLPEQSKLIVALKKEKFPKGKWVRNEWMRNFFMEKDPEKFSTMLAELNNKVKNDPDWKNFEPNLAYYNERPANLLASQKEWSTLKKQLPAIKFSSDDNKASFLNNTAWEIQKTGKDLDIAEEFSRSATEYAKKEISKPSGKKPAYLTTSQWKKQRESTYAMYADTYGMVMYKTGNYKKGFPYSKDAAIVYEKGKNANDNYTYALLAEKVLPAKQFKKELEQFIKTGAANADMKNMLKGIYVKEHGNENGFDEYLVALEKEEVIKMMEKLRKSMINEAVPTFALMDLDGKKVEISELKGKVVVVDFWATWCGPCKASFPGMQKMVSKFSNDPNVKFVFIDTWETVESKKKNAEDFIANNQYSFHVLLDNDDKVVDQFKVDGIPTKFVIDKNGMIRFKAVGFDGNDDKLVKELTAMIDMASKEQPAKAF